MQSLLSSKTQFRSTFRAIYAKPCRAVSAGQARAAHIPGDRHALMTSSAETDGHLTLGRNTATWGFPSAILLSVRKLKLRDNFIDISEDNRFAWTTETSLQPSPLLPPCLLPLARARPLNRKRSRNEGTRMIVRLKSKLPNLSLFQELQVRNFYLGNPCKHCKNYDTPPSPLPPLRH